MTVLFKKIAPHAILPTYAHFGDAGMDFYARCAYILAPGETLQISTGIAAAIPFGYFGSARERSGLALKGIRLGGGVIDSGYRGEIMGILTNLSGGAFSIAKGDRIFQLVIQECVAAEIEEVWCNGELPDSLRGTAGFGSTAPAL